MLPPDPRNPFDVLPPNVFNLFSTQGIASLQRHYMAILLRLYGLSEFTRYPLDRQVVIAEIAEYLKHEHAESDVAAHMQAEGDAPEDAAADIQNTAGYVLRRLVECGWVEREQHTDYSESILFPDYAFTLLEALRAIQQQKPREFKGQLYTAHQLITSSNKKDFSPALAITQAYENVRLVARGLSELNQNIRRYVERATRGRDVPALLKLQFDDYSHTLGPAYHAIKTSDHVSRYRRAIVDQLQRWRRSAEWMEHTANELAAQRRIPPAQANDEIAHNIAFIIQQLEALDPLIEEIDRRHAQYLKTSLRQVRYQMVGASGHFKDRLTALARLLAAERDDGDVADRSSQALQAPAVRAPDLHSLFTPPQRRRVFAPSAVGSPALTVSDLAALRDATLRDVAQALTPGKVDRLVRRLLGDAARLHARDLPADLRADLHTLTSVIAYGHHPDVHYGVEPIDGEPVPAGEFVMQPFVIVG